MIQKLTQVIYNQEQYILEVRNRMANKDFAGLELFAFTNTVQAGGIISHSVMSQYKYNKQLVMDQAKAQVGGVVSVLGLPAVEIIKNYEEDELLKSDEGSDDDYEDFRMKAMRLSLKELSLRKSSSPVK